MIKDKRILNKLDKLKGDAKCCPVCGLTLYVSDAEDLEYIKTKRGTDIFIHTSCAMKWSE